MAQDTSIRDYTGRDFSSILASLLDFAAQKLPEWTDRSPNDLGRLILESTALAADTTLYYLDRLAAEAFLSTAVERRSVIDLLELIGYTLSTPAPATAVLTLTVPNDSATPVIISPRARFATKAVPGKPAVEFLFLPEDGLPLSVVRTGAGGELSFAVSVTNAQQITETVGVSDGGANQSFVLHQTPVLLPRDPESLIYYLTVDIDPGTGFERWTRVETLLYSLSSALHFMTRVRDDDSVELVFGDGTYGTMPPPNSVVRATYLIGGGATGNVGPGTITEVKSGVSVPATCHNDLGASGGADHEAIEHAKALAPLVFRSIKRAVTATDFAALAESVEGVVRAVAVATNWNYVDVYVVAAGIAPPTPALQGTLRRFFEPLRPVTTLVSFRAPVFVDINISIEVGVNPVFYQVDVISRVRSSLTSLFQIERLDFGQGFRISKIYEAVEQVDGVDYGLVNLFNGITSTGQVIDQQNGLLQLASGQFPRLGELILTPKGGLA